MIWLVLGLLLWSAAHLFKRLAPDARAGMGDIAKGGVALALLGAVVLMVIGYRAWDDSGFLWNRESWMIRVNNLAMLVAIYLYAASGMKTRVTGIIRHPQLTGFTIWALAHLLVNGDVASLVLFGGLALWALLEIVLISRAQPDWTRNPPGPVGKEIGAVAGAVILTVAIGYAHVWFGLSPFR